MTRLAARHEESPPRRALEEFGLELGVIGLAVDQLHAAKAVCVRPGGEAARAGACPLSNHDLVAGEHDGASLAPGLDLVNGWEPVRPGLLLGIPDPAGNKDVQLRQGG